MTESEKKQKIIDLIKEITPPDPPRSSPQACPHPHLQGNHSFTINGGRVSIHLAPAGFSLHNAARHD